MGQLDIAERRLPQDGRCAVRRRRRIDRPAHRDPPHHPRREGHNPHPPALLALGHPVRSGYEPAGLRHLQARDRPALRLHRRLRPDRRRQDDDAVRGARAPEHRRARHHDDRGSGRVRDRRRLAGADQPQARSHLRPRPAHDPSLRSRRAAGGRDPRRRDGRDRRAGRAHRAPRLHHPAYTDGSQRLRPAPGHGRGAVHARQRDQLCRLAASRAQALHQLPARVGAERGRAGRARSRQGRQHDVSSAPEAASAATKAATSVAPPSTRCCR